MSLQLVANHLAQKGRGPDSTLVHMSNREVAGLQALAQKHGGQLSVNPETGLPEAGFLDNILPMVAGAGLTYLSGGAIDPMTAGGIIGGITALDSKDLSKGLTAGLGAWGGAGVVGGLAGLGAAGADTAAMAVPEYQTAVGTGAGQFANAPMASLSTLGGGSALKGGLPILAGLAPAAAEALDEEDDDNPPKLKKGYIRKYALDPVTGQYKQVGVYEAGGDPNKDVSSEAGTAGAFGAVGQSEYEKAHGMAEGGTATDSSRIYDYLMGRGPNPMQFTHTQSPQVDYSPYMPKPITPTTPILEQQYDEYGNPIGKTANRGESGQSQEQRDAREAALDERNDYLSTPENPVTMRQYWDMPKEQRDALDKAAAERNPIRAGIGNFVKTVVMPGGLFGKIAEAFVGGPMADPRAFADIPGNEGFVKKATEFGGDFYTPSLGGAEAGRTDALNISAAREQAQQAAQARFDSDRQANAIAAAQAAAQSDTSNYGNEVNRGSSRSGVGGEGGGYSNANAGDYGWARSGGGEGGGWAAGGTTHGGIAALAHQYNLGSYSDGGRLLKGPGDGVSDDIPATIGHGQPARLADGEFVIPARIVSEIGNGSTDAGARELYKMMDRIQAGRRKTVGKDQVARNTKAVRHLPA